MCHTGRDERENVFKTRRNRRFSRIDESASSSVAVLLSTEVPAATARSDTGALQPGHHVFKSITPNTVRSIGAGSVAFCFVSHFGSLFSWIPEVVNRDKKLRLRTLVGERFSRVAYGSWLRNSCVHLAALARANKAL